MLEQCNAFVRLGAKIKKIQVLREELCLINEL